MAADAPSPPSIKIIPGANAVYNDPQLTARIVDALRQNLGTDSVIEMPAKMTSEDFSAYGRAGVSAVLLHIGAVSPATLSSGAKIPDLHSHSGFLNWNPRCDPWWQRKW